MSTTLEPRPRSSGVMEAEPEPVRTARVATFPILILNPYERCNCRCGMCDIWKVPGRAALDPAWVAAEAPAWWALGVRRVVLTGGEPLMHPDIWALARPLAEAGIGLTLLSTGLLLARHAESIARWVDDVIVSLDGPPAIHDEVRGLRGAYGRLAAGVQALHERAPGVEVSARCTLQRANFAHLAATIDAARELGLDRISFLAADVSSEAFNRPGGWDAERQSTVALSSVEVAQFRAVLAEVFESRAADFSSGFVAESPAKLARLADYFAAIIGEGPFPPVRCNAPWVSAVVEADGTLRPCFFHAAMGTWTGDGLAEQLNGPAALAFRGALDVATNPICQRCVCSLNYRAPE